jgi:hypothetical protein
VSPLSSKLYTMLQQLLSTIKLPLSLLLVKLPLLTPVPTTLHWWIRLLLPLYLFPPLLLLVLPLLLLLSLLLLVLPLLLLMYEMLLLLLMPLLLLFLPLLLLLLELLLLLLLTQQLLLLPWLSQCLVLRNAEEPCAPAAF